MQENVILIGEKFYEKQKRLKLVKQLNWENYYIDELTSEKWLEEYPNSQLHGGGVPQLRLIEKFPWDE
jgi:hypothetical protein